MTDHQQNSRARFIRRIAVFLSSILVVGLASSNSYAQKPSQQERQETIDWFVNKYYYPKAICIFAGPVERARHDELLATIRKENLRAFEAAEKAPEYTATVAKLQPLIDQRFRGKSNQPAASAECTHLTDQMEFAQKRRRHDALFEMLLKMFAPPT